MSLLHQAFNTHWQGRIPLVGRSSEDPHADEILDNEHVLLSGGPASNAISKIYLNFFQRIWHVDMSKLGTICEDPKSEPEFR